MRIKYQFEALQSYAVNFKSKIAFLFVGMALFRINLMNIFEDYMAVNFTGSNNFSKKGQGLVLNQSEGIAIFIWVVQKFKIIIQMIQKQCTDNRNIVQKLSQPTANSQNQKEGKSLMRDLEIKTNGSSITNQNIRFSVEKPEFREQACNDPWQTHEIQNLFKFYDEVGSEWKKISQKMSHMTANNLKNRFYTILRNLVKLLFRKLPVQCPKLPGQIPSRELSRLYDAKQSYDRFPRVISSILKDLGYSLESPQLNKVVQKYQFEIINIYQVVYRQRQKNTDGHPKTTRQSVQNSALTQLTAQESLKKSLAPSQQNSIKFINHGQTESSTNVPAYYCYFLVLDQGFQNMGYPAY